MNNKLIKTYLQAYKDQFVTISNQELYKWKAVKQFQDNWNIDAKDFHGMLTVALSQTFNLLDSGLYYPKRMLLECSNLQPETVRALFENLYNEEEDLYLRIENFRAVIKQLVQANFDVGNDYQDHRAVLVYLVLRYPDRYYFYKYGMFKIFASKIEYTYHPIKGRIDNVSHFNNLCENLKYIIGQDQELLRLHNNRLTEDCYIDDGLNILTQDFIYAVVRYLQIESIPLVDEADDINVYVTGSKEVTVATSTFNFNPSIINHIQNDKENKRIGDLGEMFVVQLERERLRNANKPRLANKVAHHAKDKGDGLGYDVLSFDEDGNEMFIEVKTTKSNKNAAFYITRNELERSKVVKEKFYLYRVFNFDDELLSGDVLIIKGDVSNLCVEPFNYKIKISN